MLLIELIPSDPVIILDRWPDSGVGHCGVGWGQSIGIALSAGARPIEAIVPENRFESEGMTAFGTNNA